MLGCVNRRTRARCGQISGRMSSSGLGLRVMLGAVQQHSAGALARLVAAAAAAWLVAAPAGLWAQDAPAAREQYREVRPAAGTGQRGLLEAPAWLVWAFGAALVAASGWALWDLARER